MTMTSSDVLIFITGLLTLFCPPVAMPMYASVTGHFPDSTQRQIAWRLFAWIGALMVGAVWRGQFLLRMLGLTLGALTLTGGLVLCLWSIPMMRGTSNDERRGGTVKLEYAQWRSSIEMLAKGIGNYCLVLLRERQTMIHTGTSDRTGLQTDG
jgi:multiple antibiotic resistance protein